MARLTVYHQAWLDKLRDYQSCYWLWKVLVFVKTHLCGGVSCEREWKVRGGHCCREMSESGNDRGEGTDGSQLDAKKKLRDIYKEGQGDVLLYCNIYYICNIYVSICMTVMPLTTHYRLWPFEGCK